MNKEFKRFLALILPFYILLYAHKLANYLHYNEEMVPPILIIGIFCGNIQNFNPSSNY